MADNVTFATIRNQLASRSYAPVYLLHGEEGYYTDELVKMFESILPESERDFNLYTMYAPQTDAATVMDACRRYPMMADHQVVIVKEAQSVGANFLNALAPYAEKPSPTTILVIVARGAAVKAATLIKKMAVAGGVVFEARKLTDERVGPVIRDFIAENGLNIEDKALSMLQDYVGTDLARIHNEIGKLAMVLGPGAMVTPESIERNIGVSKDYNNSEFLDAIAMRDEARCYRIVDYFRRNPKNNPTMRTASVIFIYFSNLLTAFYAKDRSDRGLTEHLGLRWMSSREMSNLKKGMKNYTAWQAIEIIDAIRRFDASSKGVGSRFDQYDLLLQLTFTILTCKGELTL